MSTAQPTATSRLTMLDSLRGITALFITVFHLLTPAIGEHSSPLTRTLHDIFLYSFMGVPTFFVISGFVIAASTKPRNVNFKYLGKFIGKRAIRLDPPYWVSIAVEIALIFVTIHLFNITTSQLPSLPQTAAHFVYLQDLLGLGNISANYWTLCLEVQLYIFLCLTFAVSTRLQSLSQNDQTFRNSAVAIMFVTVTVSLFMAAGILKNPVPGLFLPVWYTFAFGAICYWATIGNTVPKTVMIVCLICASIAFVVQVQRDFFVSLTILSTILSTLFIYVAGVKGKLSTWLNSKPLLYFGSLSYSLYLFHGSIGQRYIAFIQEWLAPRYGFDTKSDWCVMLILLSAIAVCIIFSHIIYVLIEIPAMNLSKRIKPAGTSSIWKDLTQNKRPATETTASVREGFSQSVDRQGA